MGRRLLTTKPAELPSGDSPADCPGNRASSRGRVAIIPSMLHRILPHDPLPKTETRDRTVSQPLEIEIRAAAAATEKQKVLVIFGSKFFLVRISFCFQIFPFSLWASFWSLYPSKSGLIHKTYRENIAGVASRRFRVSGGAHTSCFLSAGLNPLK